LARKLLDDAWPKYPEALDRIRAGASGLRPAPQSILEQVVALLGIGPAPFRVGIIVFVGGFESNAFATGKVNGVTTIAVPVEDTDEQHANAMAHEFTHAVQAELGDWQAPRSVAETVFAEGIAMRGTQRLVPWLGDTDYTHGGIKWLQRCEHEQASILRGMRPHLSDSGAEAVSRFTVGNGGSDLHREAYCAGWLVVGYALERGSTFRQLAHLSQRE